jgi:hypothetical protein
VTGNGSARTDLYFIAHGHADLIVGLVTPVAEVVFAVTRVLDPTSHLNQRRLRASRYYYSIDYFGHNFIVV